MTMAFAKLVSGIFVFGSVTALVAAGCGGSDGLPPLEGLDGSVDPNNNPSGKDSICLLNNCDTDRECKNCSGDRTTCNQKEHRCVACGPEAGGKNCGAGQSCTKYGDCVPGGVSCNEDASGKPTITCASDADCSACGPNFKVCDPAAKKCVGCTTANVTNCQSTDVCTAAGDCVPACPATCKADADCGKCGAPGAENHACNRGVCAKCSETKACPNANEICNDVGDCEKTCGVAKNPNKCNTDADCTSCQGGLTKCTGKPIGGGLGTCAAAAAGCEQLGTGVFVLPDPFSRVTQACSTDANCANVSAKFDVGSIIKKATGLNVNSATLDYPMHACASVDILDGKKCGVCVPCKKDADCTPIDVQKFAGDAFGPIGSIAAAILLDKAFGPSDRKVHMYCQKINAVAGGEYGACVPCPSFFQRCGDAAVDTDNPATACDHGVCTVGAALGATCDSGCAGRVAQKDPFCTSKTGFWDQKCKDLVESECTNITCNPNTCAAPRDSGWYCRNDASEGGYRCNGGETGSTIAEGRQCPTSPKQYCHRQNPNDVKSKAVLCTSEGEAGCGAGSVGKAKCFTTP